MSAAYASSSSTMTLNIDIMMLVIEYLDVDDLVCLSSTCKYLHSLVHDFGWSIFLRNNQRHSATLYSSRITWSPFKQVRFNTLADRAWSRVDFIARPLSRPWSGSLRSAIALSVSTVLVAAGRSLISYTVRGTSDASPSRIAFEHSYTFGSGRNVIQPHITSVAFLPDDGQDRGAFIGHEDGSVERFDLSLQVSHPNLDTDHAPRRVLQHHGGKNAVQSISCSSQTLLSLSQRGSVLLTNLLSGSTFPTINLGIRSWSSHLCMSASSPYAVFGITSTTPLFLYPITPDGLSPTSPLSLMSPKNGPSAVYGITSAPPSSPLGPSQQIIVSGWFDGSVRIYDLRVPHHSHPPALSLSSSTTSLLPVLTLRDPWSPEPIYSVSCGGGNASFVAAGMARHGVVAFWDVRQPSQGWSVHAPGNDSSPVYSVFLESSRLFGVTQSRPFVYDFGRGIMQDTYPSIAPTGLINRRMPMEDKLQLEQNGIGYYVLKYSHRRMAIF